MSHGMRIVARSQTAKCGALGARRRASEQDPSPPSLPCSRNIGTACGLLHWVDGGALGRTSQRFSVVALIDRSIELPIARCTFSNSASNLTDMILHLFWYQGGRGLVFDPLWRKEARVNPAQRRRGIAFPLYFLHDDADSLRCSALPPASHQNTHN